MASARNLDSPTGPLSTREEAAALGVHERALRRYISSGRLVHRKLPGGRYRIPTEAILDFWARLMTPNRAISEAFQCPSQRLSKWFAGPELPSYAVRTMWRPQ